MRFTKENAQDIAAVIFLAVIVVLASEGLILAFRWLDLGQGIR